MRDSTVVVTGGAKGIGLAVVQRFVALGDEVIALGRDEEALARLEHARTLVCDVTDEATVAATFAEIGAVDVLVNNAGIAGPRLAPADTTAPDFLACFGVNLLGPVRVTHAFLPLLRLSADPRVVMVSSGLGSFAVTADPDRLEAKLQGLIYQSSKAALNMVTTQYARAIPDVRFNAVDPGYTATDLNGHNGFQTVSEGTEAIVTLASAGTGGPTGGFFNRSGPVAW